MKSEYKAQLIKDIVIAGIAWGVGFALFISDFHEYGFWGFFMAFFAGLMLAGIPFGWKWLSNVFIAVSIFTIALKALGALFLGWIALPVVIIKDVIAYKKAE